MARTVILVVARIIIIITLLARRVIARAKATIERLRRKGFGDKAGLTERVMELGNLVASIHVC